MNWTPLSPRMGPLTPLYKEGDAFPAAAVPHPYPYSTNSLPSSSTGVMDLQYLLSPAADFIPPRQPIPQLYSDHETNGQEEPSHISIRAFKHVQPNSEDGILSFDSVTNSFTKPHKSASQPPMDPYAEDFLKDVLGPEKWEIFSARLFERRLGAKARLKSKGKIGDEGDGKGSVSAIEFLVKVEVVKEILRTYVPHPYNPLKSLAHSYSRAPSGQVTLTRSTVLQLSGWSNTQFSYWARRAEAVSVLSDYDSRLRAVGKALERRLRDNAFSDEGDEEEAALVTGKGLDAIVDEVKKRTGKSQFLRGKHSSLDPYGTVVSEDESPQQFGPPTLYAMPTFQAERYNHYLMRSGLDRPRSPPLSLGANPPPVSPPSAPKRRLLPTAPPEPAFTEIQNASHQPPRSSGKAAAVSPDSEPTTLSATTPSGGLSTAQRPNENSAQAVQNFPLSDSRSEMELALAKGKRKPGEKDKFPPGQKRIRTFSGSDDES